MTISARWVGTPALRIGLLAVAVCLAVVTWYIYTPHTKDGHRSSVPGVETARALAEARRVLQGASQTSSLFFTVDPRQLDFWEKVKAGPTLRDWRIQSEKSLDSKTTSEVISILTSEGTYADMGAKCFDPGLGFRFDQGFYSVELVICLDCLWVYAYHKGNLYYWALSIKGREDLLRIYKNQVPSIPK